MRAIPFRMRRQFKPGDRIIDIQAQRIVTVVKYSRGGRNIRVHSDHLNGEYERDGQYFAPLGVDHAR